MKPRYTPHHVYSCTRKLVQLCKPRMRSWRLMDCWLHCAASLGDACASDASFHHPAIASPSDTGPHWLSVMPQLASLLFSATSWSRIETHLTSNYLASLACPRNNAGGATVSLLASSAVRSQAQRPCAAPSRAAIFNCRSLMVLSADLNPGANISLARHHPPGPCVARPRRVLGIASCRTRCGLVKVPRGTLQEHVLAHHPGTRQRTVNATGLNRHSAQSS